MRWIAASILGIVLTVAVMAYVGRPKPLDVVIPEFDRRDDLEIANIRTHLEAMTATPSRISGTPGALQAADYIANELRNLGVSDLEEQPFEVATPIVEDATLTAADGSILNIHPLWPNLARTCQTPPEGLSGPVVDVGRGIEVDLAGQAIRDAVVLINWDTDDEWLDMQEFGPKAVIFCGDRPASAPQARKKFLSVPASVPRFYVGSADVPGLRARVGETVTVKCRMDWDRVPSKNLLARLTDGNPPPNAPPVDRTPVIFHAYYDCVSTVPTLAPGAEQACGAAVLLEVARYIKSLPEQPPRPVYLLFTGAHGQHLSGMTRFVRRLSDGLKDGWNEKDRSSLTARMGSPGVFVGMDISSGSDRMGIFCLGAFRFQAEQQVRPKFSALALQLDAFARSYMTHYKDLKMDTVTPFVDCVNLTLGRSWWTYFPYRPAFESEIATLAGLPGVTLSTINDERRFVDTPDDTLENMDLDILSRQLRRIEGERAGLANLALAFTFWKGPFISSELESKLAKVEGRVVWLDSNADYTANRGMARASVALKAYRNDKHLMGTRAAPVTLTDADGAYEFDGLIDVTANEAFYKLNMEAYGAATRRFIEDNPGAAAEYRATMTRGGRSGQHIVEDGSILFATDMARPGEQPFEVSIVNPVQNVSPVVFPCRTVTLFGLTEPRGFLGLFNAELLDAANNSAPYQYGESFSDNFRGDPEENCITMWADPTLQVRLTLGLGAREKRLILINNSAQDPIGKGYKLSDLETIPSWTLDGTRSMWFLNDDRIRRFESHGIRNPRVEAFHQEARENLEQAEEALRNRDYATYRQSSERGWALETSAYSELLNMANNMIRGVLFYLLLLLPFSYCLERLLVNAAGIRGRITGMLVIFAASFVLLAVIHPAFRFTLTPLLVLVAFIILALAVSVTALVLSKFDRMLVDRKQATAGTHEDVHAAGSVAIRAIDLGIANIRRRPQRAFLTGMTVVLVTFTLLSFTSIVPEMSISRLRHREGEPVYKGLLARDPQWKLLPMPLYESLRRSFGGPDSDAAVAGRAWYYSDNAGMVSKIDVAPADLDPDQSATTAPLFVAEALIGMEPSEVRVTAVADTLVAGRWFEDEDEPGVILPNHIAEQLGFGPQDIGRSVRIFGRDMPVLGIIDGGKFDALRDIDGEPLSPVNFAQQMLNEAQNPDIEQKATFREYVHWPVNSVAIVPFKVARSLGATVRSIAISTGESLDPDSEAAAYARRSNLTILACDSERVTLYAALNRNRLSAMGQIIVPVLLGFVMVLGTMLGSVYERHREIFVYNSVGLSPTNVASLFLAESAVYAVLGAAAGYLLGNGVSKLLQATGVLSHISLNYSAGTTVFVTALTMGMVLISAVYPARQAFRAAIPSQRKVFEGFESDDDSAGDRISLYLPFVSMPGNVFPMQAYMHEFFQGVEGVSVGQVAVDDLLSAAETEAGRSTPVLRFRAWMAPFDLGISHDADLRIVYREDRGVYQYHLTATRFSGDAQNWKRLLPRFLLALRKQLLMWRILSQDEQEKYRERARALFGQTEPEGQP